jgi:hypothetical protein
MTAPESGDPKRLGRPRGFMSTRPGTERHRYRGYEIVPQRQWSSWCAGIYPTRADLPLLKRSTLDTLAARQQEAVAEAKQAIDEILAQLGHWRTSRRRES